jgi:hypothetical protein
MSPLPPPNLTEVNLLMNQRWKLWGGGRERGKEGGDGEKGRV